MVLPKLVSLVLLLLFLNFEEGGAFTLHLLHSVVVLVLPISVDLFALLEQH